MSRANLAVAMVVAGAAVALLCAVGAAADAPNPGDIVPGHPGVTYLDLLKQEVPDLATDKDSGQLQGHLPKSLPNLAGKAFDADAPDPVTVRLYETARTILAGGKRRIVLLADLGAPPDTVQSVTLLALFDDSPKPRLLDAVDVGMNEDNGFNEPDHFALSPRDEALITYSEHSNTSITDSSRLALFVRNDRFQLIGAVSAQAERGCGWLREAAPTFSARPDPGRAYPMVELVVRDVLKRTREDCGDQKRPAAYARTYRVTYRWNAAGRFEAPAAELKSLKKLGDSHFPDE